MKISIREMKKAGWNTLKHDLGDLMLVKVLADFGMTVISLLSITIGSYIFSGPVEYGVIKTYYRGFIGEDVDPKDGLAGFKERFGESFLAGFVITVIKAIPVALLIGVLFSVISAVLSATSILEILDFGMDAESLSASIASLIAIAAVDVLCAILLYGFRMTYFVLMHEKNLNAFDALKASAVMMKGEKFRAFIFDLSFALWWLTILFTAGVGKIWVGPYYTSSKVVFMAEVYSRKREGAGLARDKKIEYEIENDVDIKK